MLKNFITTIDYKALIEMQANQQTYWISKEKVRCLYKNPIPSNQKSKVRKIGRKIGRK